MAPVITPPGFIQATNWLTLVTELSNIGGIQGLLGPWRPPQWNQEQLFSLTVTEVINEATSHQITFGGGVIGDTTDNPNIRQNTKSTTYFFDAILRAEHRQELRKTEHPIQSGASIVDHCYLIPANVSLEIGMSDCMARFRAGQFTSDGSKSISAYQTLKDLQKKRVPLTLTTRLDQYTNMVIESIGAIENSQTRFGLRASVRFAQIIVAKVATTTVSARPDQTDLTNEGTKQTLPPSPTVANSSSLAGFP
jgi:hypothetical protein